MHSPRSGRSINYSKLYTKTNILEQEHFRLCSVFPKLAYLLFCENANLFRKVLQKKNTKQKDDIRYFTFPHEEEARKKWIIACGYDLEEFNIKDRKSTKNIIIILVQLLLFFLGIVFLNIFIFSLINNIYFSTSVFNPL